MIIRTELRLSSRNILAIIRAIILLNIFLLAGTYVFNTVHQQLPFYLYVVTREADLASENVFASWFSSMMLLLCAMMALFCFLVDEQRLYKGNKRIWNYGWLGYAAAFALLSFDELGSIHEYIGNFAAFKETGKVISNTKESGWILFYVLVAVVGLFMLLFSFVKLKKARWSLLLLIAGVLFYLSNPIQEYFEIETMRVHATDDVWRRPVYFILIEEGTELLGSLFFLMALMAYVKDHIFVKRMQKNALMKLVFLFLFAAAMCLLLIKLVFGDVRGDVQNGVPKNWITSASAFILTIYCFIAYRKRKMNSYLLCAIFSLCLSFYLGDNRFAWYFDSDYSAGRVMLKLLLSAFATFAYLMIARQFQNGVAKALLLVSLAILIGGLFIRRLYSAEMAFCGIAIFWILLIAEDIKYSFSYDKLAKGA